MFDKVLIANRGEIACRLIRTARRMGLKTVAVYSDADKGALHVESADEAVHLGPPAAAQSYLDIGKIVDACRKTGAQAVHPGFGFLSENPAFASALAEAGIVFVGPPASVIAEMGDKLEAKRLANVAAVPTIPGPLAPIRDGAHAEAEAAKLGYPVLLKPSAGCGGKGIRIVHASGELAGAIERARSEARAAFGDDRLLLEKAVPAGRHIEVQILADTHGDIVHLGERECSVQRRHQKVVEEAPAPIDARVREAAARHAIALAEQVGYVSAGTVEFLLAQDGQLYFLEMNTRLQVEHPVTELVYGLDIVELMFRIAAGEKLGLAQADLQPKGWAIEARLYAEDPTRDFAPSTGKLTRFRAPDNPKLRLETGVREGDEVTPFYDPMLAKICVHDTSRYAALKTMSETLGAFQIEGVGANLAFLRQIVEHADFRAGKATTDFIAEKMDLGGAAKPAAASAGGEVRAPLPGVLSYYEVSVGQKVEAGDTLAILEAMKMEHEIKAESDGEVAELVVEPGTAIAQDDLVVRLR
jgi:propionyl-CoA carboxylase alpha chain